MSKNFQISPIRVPKAADVLAERLRGQILSGKVEEGKQLPTERELAELTGLSRASVREALRILEVEGLLTTRPGRGGGSAIRMPTTEGLQRSISLFLRGRQFRLQSLLQAREAIEPAVSRLAARNRSQEDLDRLTRIHEALVASQGDHAAYVRLNLDWHLAITNASKNELLIAFMNAISEEMLNGMAIDAFDSPEVRMANIRSHEQIMKAVREKDGEAAERRMARHVKAFGRDAEAALTQIEVSVSPLKKPRRQSRRNGSAP